MINEAVEKYNLKGPREMENIFLNAMPEWSGPVLAR
jgi:hypothetical protein